MWQHRRFENGSILHKQRPYNIRARKGLKGEKETLLTREDREICAFSD